MDTTNTQGLGGPAEIAIGALTIGAQFLTEVTPNFEEGTRTTNTLAGVRNRPSGQMETAEVNFSMIVPSMDALKAVFQHMYEAPTGTGANLSGRINIGSSSCQTQQPLPVNIHYTCEPNSDNDQHFYACLARFTWNPTMNNSDELTVSVSLMPQLYNGAYGFLGAGSLAEKTLWDAATQSFVAVGESE